MSTNPFFFYSVIRPSSASDFMILIQFSSVAQLCLTLCNLKNCHMPGFPVLHHLPKLA